MAGCRSMRYACCNSRRRQDLRLKRILSVNNQPQRSCRLWDADGNLSTDRTWVLNDSVFGVRS